MQQYSEININIVISNSLNTRNEAIYLFDLIGEEVENLTFNFDGIIFMSRAFADEFYNLRKRKSEKGILISIENASEEIISILEIVSKTQSKSENKKNKSEVLYFSDLHSLSKYLFTV